MKIANDRCVSQGLIIFLSLITLSLSCVQAFPPVTKPGCSLKCGTLDVPFPFGIDPGCFLEGFRLTCEQDLITREYKLLHDGIELLQILLPTSQVRMYNGISEQCFDKTIDHISSTVWQFNYRDSQYRLSPSRNRFVAIGCDTLAYTTFFYYKNNSYRSGCLSVCYSLDSLTNGSCSGLGCCETLIPPGINFYNISFDRNYNSSNVSHFSPCSYAVVMDTDNFTFSTSYVTGNEFQAANIYRAPILLDWFIENVTCEVAQRNTSTYACISSNSVCTNLTNGPGYICKCSQGYEGNPYLENGCQDIDECANKNWCSKKCHNLPGTYRCSCSSIMRLKDNTTGECEIYVPFVFGIGAGILLLVFVGFCMYVAFETRKLSKLKEEYFQQHGGWILLEEIKSNLGFSFKIFSKQQVEAATNNFNCSNIIGQGGQGTVYKGAVNDQLVAIKKCKIIDERKKKEFGKEMLILSQISHKNIVKLLGCCLEVEVPMLVYEFIPCGTLFQRIHDNKHRYSCITLETRLRIAHESAEALAYLHYSASPPIFHGDIKSSNILLDENYVAKVSDFGASILAPTDESQIVTHVQGTCGYLDPEYLQSCQLTDKSDVYSFGVVLLELLTSKPVIHFDALEGEKSLSLSSLFLSAMKENSMPDLLDVQIKREDDMEIIYRVAELAKGCLNVNGEDRPTMKQVAEELDRIRKLKTQQEIPIMKTQNLIGESSDCIEMDNTGNFGIEHCT